MTIFRGSYLTRRLHMRRTRLPRLLTTGTRSTSVKDTVLSSIVPLDRSLRRTIVTLPFPYLQVSTVLEVPFDVTCGAPRALNPSHLTTMTNT